MDLEEIIIDTSDQPDSSVLIIYTGGTMGMGQNKSGVLVSFNFQEILNRTHLLDGQGGCRRHGN